MPIIFTPTQCFNGCKCQLSIYTFFRSADMAFTFAAPNAVHYNAATIRQVNVNTC